MILWCHVSALTVHPGYSIVVIAAPILNTQIDIQLEVVHINIYKACVVHKPSSTSCFVIAHKGTVAGANLCWCFLTKGVMFPIEKSVLRIHKEVKIARVRDLICATKTLCATRASQPSGHSHSRISQP